MGGVVVITLVDDAQAKGASVASKVLRLALLVLGMLFRRGQVAASAQARGFNEFFCRTPTWAMYAWYAASTNPGVCMAKASASGL